MTDINHMREMLLFECSAQVLLQVLSCASSFVIGSCIRIKADVLRANKNGLSPSLPPLPIKYGRFSLSQIPRDSLKYFEISVLRHIRFAELRKN